MDDISNRLHNRFSEKSEQLSSFLKKQKKAVATQLTRQQKPAYNRLPASFAQQRLWFLDQLNHNSAYTMIMSFPISGELDFEAFRRAFNEIITRHQILRTNLVLSEGQLLQIIAPPFSSAFNLIDLSILSEAVRQKEVQLLTQKEAQRVFDLAHERLFQVTLLRLASDEHMLLLAVHHSIFDGWSAEILKRELSALYDAFRQGKPFLLPELPLQYVDVALWQQQQFQNRELEGQLGYWQAHLAGAPASISLPTDRAYPLTKTFKGATHAILLPRELSQALKILSQRQRATLFTTLLAALKILLFQWTGQADIVIGTVVTGRSRPEVQNLLGCFINFVALRSQLSPEQAGLDFLNQVRAGVINAYKYQDCPFEKVVEVLKLSRQVNYNPLYNVAFLLQNYGYTSPTNQAEAPFPSASAHDGQSSLLDLRFVGWETPHGMQITCEYDTDLFEAETIEQLNTSYRQILEQLVSNPEQKLAAYTLSPGLVTQMERVRAKTSRLTLSITSTFTAEPLEEVIDFWLRKFALSATLTFAPYNQVFQQLLDPESLLSRNTQGVNVVLLRFEDWFRYTDHLVLSEIDEEAIHKIKGDVDTFVQSLRLAAQRTPVPYLLYLCPPSPGLADDPFAQTLFQQLEDQCTSGLRHVQGVYLVNSADIMTRYPVPSYYDPYMDQQGHVPFTPLFFTALGTTIFRQICAVWRISSHYKVLALDCDNTLWKGICGEDGPTHIEIDHVSRSVQAFLLAQCHAGLLVCLCSRNNEQDVYEVFTLRKEMVLRWEHLAGWRINWEEKSDNLSSLAQELNIGLEHFIFLDDSPRECAEVRARCPQVLTIQLPEQREAHPRLLQHLWPLDHLQVTQEDQQRTEHYRQERERRDLRRKGLSIQRFLEELDVQVQITRMSQLQLERVAQLTRRTNQFNTTTSRKSEQELIRWLQGPEREILVVEVQDRFGSYGLVGAIFLERSPEQIKVESLMLSCRVLGRGVEHRIVAHIGHLAQVEGRMVVCIAYQPTAKNVPVKAFLEQVAAEWKRPAGEGSIFALPSQYASAITLSRPETETTQEQEDARADAAPGDVEPTSSALLSVIATELFDVELIQRQITAQPRNMRILPEQVIVPRTPIEEIVAEIWCQVLKLDQVGIADSFFALGGHSLLATQVIARLRTVFQLDLSVSALFETPTITGLARYIEEFKQVNLGLQPPPPLVARSRMGDLPLSFAQERLWFLEQMDRGSSAYHNAIVSHIQGPLSPARLQQSINQLVQRHEGLRTIFVASAGRPAQVILPTLTLPLPIIDLQALPPAQWRTTISALIAQEVHHPFDLARGPLLRTTLLRLNEQDQFLLLTIHHIVSDGWSMNLFQQELTVLYQEAQHGHSSSLPPLPIQYVDYALWQREWLQGETLDRQIAYWRQHLAGITPLELPTDHPRPLQQRFRGASQSLSIAPELCQQLKELGQQEGVTLFMTVLAAFQVLLARYSGQYDITLGTPIANRTPTETEAVLGLFANTLVLRTRLTPHASFLTHLARVREVTLGAYDHQDLPFEKLVEVLQPERDISRNPLFQVMFSLQNRTETTDSLHLSSVAVSPVPMENTAAKFDLTVALLETPQGLVGGLEYNTDLFADTTAARMVKQFQTLLAAAVKHPETALADLPLLTREEREDILVRWNATDADLPHEQSIHTLFEAQAADVPDAIAVVFGESQLTYAAFNRQANRLAHYLQARGVGPETLVGIYLERSLELLIGLLAILKAGGAYVPLDPTYPTARLTSMIDDAHLSLVLSQRSLTGRCSFSPPCIEMDTEWLALEQECAANPEWSGSGEQLAYLIYTSGSTGKPKAVQIPHQAVLNFMHAMTQEPGLTRNDILLALTSISFDIAALELFLPLSQGARVVIGNKEAALESGELVTLLDRSGATILQATPSTWRLLLATSWPGNRELVILCGGEALPRDLANVLLTHGKALWNLYGPTETTIWSTLQRVLPQDEQVLIGHPLANTSVYLLDQRLQPVPVGVPGHLYIGGMGLARGYLRRPDLTAERFIPHPFSREPGARLYRTGDLARALPGGALECLGRTDSQIKLRGYRIELGEIEAVLLQHPAVREAAVLFQQGEDEASRRIVAYFVGEQKAGPGPTHSQLWSFLQELLPAFMIPALFVPLERMPLTSSGKQDRLALALLQPERSDRHEAFVPASSPVEKALATIWSAVLRAKSMSIHDNFFALGGNSLLATQILFQIRITLEVDLSLRTLFTAPTIAQLAAQITALRSGDQPEERRQLISAEQGPVTGPVPLTSGQRWVLNEMNASPPHYSNMSYVFATRQALHPVLLEESIRHLLRHHDVLRLRLVREEAEWRTVIAPPDEAPIPFTWINLSGLSEAEQEKMANTMAFQLQEDLNQVKGWLLRIAYFDFGSRKPGHLVLIFSHLVCDYFSTEILFHDFLRLYQQLAHGERASFPPKTTSFQQWAERLNAYFHSEELKQELTHFWLMFPWERFTPLPLDYPEGKNVNTIGAVRFVRQSLSMQETSALNRCLNAETQILDVLLTALVQAFYRWTGSPLLYTHMLYHGRELTFDDLDMSRTIGYIAFAKMFPLDISQGNSSEEALRQVQARLHSLPHQAIGLDLLFQLGDDATQERLRRIPEAEVHFEYRGETFQNPSEESLFLPVETSYQASWADNHDAKRNKILFVGFETIEGCLHIIWEYSEKIHKKETIERLGLYYREALRELISYLHRDL